jgi:glutamate formiminotransferase
LHPALGIVDHVAVHPLIPGAEGMANAAALAGEVGAGLGAAGVPVYLYGHAAHCGRTLADIRRALGYFARGTAAAVTVHPPPDHGPHPPQLPCGVSLVGATPWVVNLNVPLATVDLAAARVIARTVSSRGGGSLPGVEALGLAHGDGHTEVACNVRDLEAAPLTVVEAAVKAAAEQAGVAVGAAYVTGRDPASIVDEAARVLGLEIVD